MKSRFAWEGLLFLWLYSGILRNLLPQLNYVLYLLPFLIAFTYFLAARSIFKSAETIRVFLLLFLILIFTFQTMHYLFRSIDLKVIFTGLILYGMAPTIIFIGFNSEPCKLLQPLIRSIEIAIPINLVLVALQIIGNLEFFRISPLTGGEAMTTDGNVLRALGTFTHPTGYATFLSVASVIVIYQFESETRMKRSINLFQLGFLYLLSGSRTVFINLALIILTLVYLKRRSLREQSRLGSSRIVVRIIIALGLAFVLLRYEFGWVLESFASRISAASTQENSMNRILNQSFGWYKDIGESLWGQGLSSYSSVSIGFAKDRSAWIENDLTKIIVEAGSVLGIAIILLRWALPLYIHIQVKNSQTEKKVFIYLLLSACFTNLMVGALTGQGSVSLQVWICLSLCINLTRNTRRKQKS